MVTTRAYFHHTRHLETGSSPRTWLRRYGRNDVAFVLICAAQGQHRGRIPIGEGQGRQCGEGRLSLWKRRTKFGYRSFT
jgi:hypothetical protein